MSKGRKRAAGKRPLDRRIDHATFFSMLDAAFPDVVSAISECSQGLLHCEMGCLARATDRVIDAGLYSVAERHFRFLESVRQNATPEVENAIDVSYVEYFALGEWTPGRHEVLKHMPPSLRAVLLEIDGRARWA